MPSLLVVVFVVELAVQLINTLGAATINATLWRIFESLPTKLSKDFAEQRKLQKEYLGVRKELNATSSQDEFAKWAKLRRTHDKLLEQLDNKKKSLEASKASFDRTVTGVRWFLTRGLQWFLPFWFAKQPIFWLPYGWFPYYIEWLVSFPRAPLGSVSIAAWQVACSGALTLIMEAITAALALAVAAKQKQAVPVATGDSTKANNEKKDL